MQIVAIGNFLSAERNQHCHIHNSVNERTSLVVNAKHSPYSAYPSISASTTAVTLCHSRSALEGSLFSCSTNFISIFMVVRIWVIKLQLGCSHWWDIWSPTLGFLAFDTCQLLYPVFLNSFSVARTSYSLMLLTYCTKLCCSFSCTHCSCMDGGITSLLPPASSSDISALALNLCRGWTMKTSSIGRVILYLL